MEHQHESALLFHDGDHSLNLAGQSPQYVFRAVATMTTPGRRQDSAWVAGSPYESLQRQYEGYRRSLVLQHHVRRSMDARQEGYSVQRRHWQLPYWLVPSMLNRPMSIYCEQSVHQVYHLPCLRRRSSELDRTLQTYWQREPGVPWKRYQLEEFLNSLLLPVQIRQTWKSTLMKLSSGFNACGGLIQTIGNSCTLDLEKGTLQRRPKAVRKIWPCWRIG